MKKKKSSIKDLPEISKDEFEKIRDTNIPKQKELNIKLCKAIRENKNVKIKSLAIKSLVKKGAQPHAYGVLSTAIHSYRGGIDIIKYLVENGATINGDVMCSTAGYGDQKILEYFISKGGQIDIEDLDGTPLCSALRGQKPENIKYLIDKGATINKKYGEGQDTCLHLAAQLSSHYKDNITNMCILIKNGGNLFIKNKKNDLPVDIFASQLSSRMGRENLTYLADFLLKEYKLSCSDMNYSKKPLITVDKSQIIATLCSLKYVEKNLKHKIGPLVRHQIISDSMMREPLHTHISRQFSKFITYFQGTDFLNNYMNKLAFQDKEIIRKLQTEFKEKGPCNF